MPLVPTVAIDGAKLYELAKAQYGTVTALAVKIGRDPRSVMNLKHDPVASVKFATQIAEALDVEVADITLPRAAA